MRKLSTNPSRPIVNTKLLKLKVPVYNSINNNHPRYSSYESRQFSHKLVTENLDWHVE